MQDALPVRLDVADPIAGRLRAWLEGTLGWQVVDDPVAPSVPPVCTLVGVGGTMAPRNAPAVFLVGPEDDPVDAARAAARLDPIGILRWPQDREALPELVAGMRTGLFSPSATTEELRIGGASGGVGTTTVALALGGLLAWQGRPVLAVVPGAVPLDGVRTLSADDLAGSGTWDAATSAPGCPNLRVIRCPDAHAAEAVDAGPASAIIRDLGVDEAPDVLVLRRDRRGVATLEGTTAGAVVVADEGIVPLAAVRRATAQRHLVLLPRSQRVARAVARGRCPAGLPGRWLRLVSQLLPGAHPQPGGGRRPSPVP